MSSDFASICILSYNRPWLLQKTLETIFQNTDSSFEIIIHDDGSEDEAVYQILDRYRELATIITNPKGWNQGQGIALNRMFSAAKGDPIIKCDQDLEFQGGWLSEVNRLMDNHPSIGLLGLCHYFLDPVDMRALEQRRYDEYSVHPIILGSAFALRRITWDALGPFEEYSDAFNEDGAMQRKVSNESPWYCALPHRELAANPNMGPGPDRSTVVFQNPDGSIGVSKIKHGPYVHRR